MTYKFENIAEVGDVIKAFDFKPLPDRPDSYIIGKVVSKGPVYHPLNNVYMYEGFTIEVTKTTEKNVASVKNLAYVPYEMSMLEFDERVSLYTEKRSLKETIEEARKFTLLTLEEYGDETGALQMSLSAINESLENLEKLEK